MKMKNWSAIVVLMLLALRPGPSAAAQETEPVPPGLELTPGDSILLDSKFLLNDYFMVGVEGGASLSRMSFNPSQSQTSLFVPGTYGIFLTHYEKLFGYMPNFGFKFGVRYSHEGYKFKENKETGVTPTLEGATQAVYSLVEVPFMARLHMDYEHFGIFADAGIYGGWRTSIHREGDNVRDAVRDSFLDTDRRFDYGLTGGVGFALVFSPVEFHVNAGVRYSWGTLYDPDYRSRYFYRFAYPFDIMVTAGVYYHLTKRTGRGRAALKKEAHDRVYYPERYENDLGKGR